KRLFREEAMLRHVGPTLGTGYPVPGPARSRSKEAIGLHRRLVGISRLNERGKWRRPRFACPPTPRRVHEYAEDPGLQRGAAFETFDSCDDTEPRLLDDLLGDGALADAASREAQHHRTQLADEFGKGGLVAGA